MRRSVESRSAEGTTECRVAQGTVEVRKVKPAAGGTELTQIGGYGARFDSETVIGNWFREVIKPGAFAPVIGATADVRSLFNHDPNQVLGRTTAGTLQLVEDDIGLRYDVDLNVDDPLAVGVAARIARRDVTGSSFGFRVKREEWVEPDEGSTDLPLRIIHEFAELMDVGPVTFPAYEDTSSEARAETRAVFEGRAGRVLSAANEDSLKKARDLIDGVVKQVEEDGQNSRRPQGSRRDAPAVEDADAIVAATPAADPTGEEAAELVQYRTLATLLTQARASLDEADALVAALIAAEADTPTETAEAEAAEEEVECASFVSIVAICRQVSGAVSSVSQLAQDLLADHESDEDDDEALLRSEDADRERRLRLARAGCSTGRA